MFKFKWFRNRQKKPAPQASKDKDETPDISIPGPTTYKNETITESVRQCIVSKPTSYDHLNHAIDEFLTSTLQMWGGQSVDLSVSNPDTTQPLICFGVYMSRMDSNIVEALRHAKDRHDAMVVLIDSVKNIIKRKHDLLYYQQNSHNKRFKDITIIFTHPSQIDMTIDVNVNARGQVLDYLLNFAKQSPQQKPIPTRTTSIYEQNINRTTQGNMTMETTTATKRDKHAKTVIGQTQDHTKTIHVTTTSRDDHAKPTHTQENMMMETAATAIRDEHGQTQDHTKTIATRTPSRDEQASHTQGIMTTKTALATKRDEHVKSVHMQTPDHMPKPSQKPQSLWKWKPLRYDSMNKKNKYLAKIKDSMAKIGSGTFYWSVCGNSVRDFIDKSDYILQGKLTCTEDQQHFYFRKGKTELCMVDSSLIPAKSKHVGVIICVAANEIGGVAHKKRNTNQWIRDRRNEHFDQNIKNCLLVVTNTEKKFPHLRLNDKDPSFWTDSKMADFMSTTSTDIGLSSQFIFPVLTSDGGLSDLVLIHVWQRIIKLSKDY